MSINIADEAAILHERNQQNQHQEPNEDRPITRPYRPNLQPLPLTWGDLAKFDAIIDTRSPAEFALDHLPGAINCPVLSNEERIMVGTLHKQASPFEAKKVGAAMVARNIALTIDTQFRDKPKQWKPLIYCWRGGSRSGAMTHIFRAIGWGAVQLEGGYKAWRAQVVQDLAAMPDQFTYDVICGRTGSGKSRLLEAMAEHGAQVLDLEKIAAHKGSVLGNLPDQPQPSQKMLDSLIWAQLSQFDPTRPIFVEAESKKIGVLRVPDPLIRAMWQGRCFEVITPQPLRVELLHEEYAHLIADHELLFFKLDCLAALHSKEQILQWKALAKNGQWHEFVASMLNGHYDPAYDRSMFKNYLNIKAAAAIHITDISLRGFSEQALRLVKLSTLVATEHSC